MSERVIASATRRRLVIAAACALVAALGCADSQDSWYPSPSFDASLTSCEDVPDLTIGQCVQPGSDLPCEGTPDESRQFTPLSADAIVPMILGPQAAMMFVLALQTSGIDPGDPDDVTSTANPDVDIAVLDEAGIEVGRYRGRPAFRPHATEADLFEAVGLFVVIEGTGNTIGGGRHPLDGAHVVAIATIHDSKGAVRCGRTSFVAVAE